MPRMNHDDLIHNWNEISDEIRLLTQQIDNAHLRIMERILDLDEVTTESPWAGLPEDYDIEIRMSWNGYTVEIWPPDPFDLPLQGPVTGGFVSDIRAAVETAKKHKETTDA